MVQRDHPRAGIDVRSRFVESDVPRTADTQKLEIQAAVRLDLHVVVGTVLFQFVQRHIAVRDVDVFGQDVDMVEQMLVHEGPVALGIVAGQAVVLVQVERYHPGKGQAFLLVHADQLRIHPHGRTSRSQAQHGHLSLGIAVADDGRDLFGHRHRGDGCILEDLGVQFFKPHILPSSYFFMGDHVFLRLEFMFIFGSAPDGPQRPHRAR